MKYVLKRCLFIGLIVSCSSGFFLLKAENLATLNDYIRVALENNEGLLASWQKWQAATHQVKQVSSLPDPRLEYSRFLDSVETRTGPQENVISFSQTLPWMGRLGLRSDMASAQMRAAQYKYEAGRLQLVREVGTVFYDYAYLGKEIELEKENAELIERLAPIVQEKVRGGGALNASLRLEVERGKSVDILYTLKSTQRAKCAKLLALLGKEIDSPITLPFPTLPDFNFTKKTLSEYQKELLRKNPDIVAVGEQIKEAEGRYKLSKIRPMPDPTFSVSAIDIGDGGDTAVSVGVGFSIPLWFGKHKAKRKEMRAFWEAQQNILSHTEKQLLVHLSDGWASLSENAQRIELYRMKLLPAAKQAIEITENDYRSNKATMLDLIDAQRVLLDLEKRYWRAVARAHQSFIEVQTLSGEQL